MTRYAHRGRTGVVWHPGSAITDDAAFIESYIDARILHDSAAVAGGFSRNSEPVTVGDQATGHQRQWPGIISAVTPTVGIYYDPDFTWAHPSAWAIGEEGVLYIYDRQNMAPGDLFDAYNVVTLGVQAMTEAGATQAASFSLQFGPTATPTQGKAFIT